MGWSIRGVEEIVAGRKDVQDHQLVNLGHILVC